MYYKKLLKLEQNEFNTKPPSRVTIRRTAQAIVILYEMATSQRTSVPVSRELYE